MKPSPRISTTEIGQRLRAHSPGLIDWTPTDREYLVCGKDEFNRMVKMFGEWRAWKAAVNECEEIARRFMCKARDYEFDTDMDCNQAIGVAFLTRHHGRDENHTINCAFGTDEIYLADLQTGEVWVADPENDVIYNVEM